jgi:peptidyl-prolyl cis-trans isomerase C
VAVEREAVARVLTAIEKRFIRVAPAASPRDRISRAASRGPLQHVPAMTYGCRSGRDMRTKLFVSWRPDPGGCLSVVLASIVFACTSPMEVPQDTAAKQAEGAAVAARVNDAPIYEDQVARQVDAEARKYQKFGAKVRSVEVAKRLRGRALENLIAVELLYQAAQRLRISDVDERIEAKMQQLKKRRGSRAASGDDDALRASIRRKLYISEYFKSLGTDDPNLQEADIRRYYDEHGEEAFFREEDVHVRHIVVRFADHPDPERKLVARRKIDQARQEILGGKEFAEVARAYSEDGLAASGGDLSYIRRGHMPPEFDQVAFSLKAHTLSDVVETKHGYHLIEVLDRRPAGVVPYDEVRDFIATYLKQQASQKRKYAVIRDLRAQAKIEIVDPN